MKIDCINNNHNSVKNYNAKTFRNKGLGPDIVNHLNKNSSKLTKFLNYVGKNQGEALNIIVTAVGTAIICPLFIAFNPFSKEDSKTKTYSAWRQPISAVIAVVTQLTITKWFDDYMAKKASTAENKDLLPNFTRADLRAEPTERYLRKLVKYEHPEYNKKQVAQAIKLKQKIANKKEVARYRELYKGKNIDFKELLSQDYYDKAEGMFFDEFKTKNKAEIEAKFGKKIDEIWSLSLDKHLDKMLDDKAKALGKDRQTLIAETAETMVKREVTAEAVVKSAIRYFKDKNVNIDKAIESCTEEGVLRYIKNHGLEKQLADGIDAKQVAQDIIRKLNTLKEYEFNNRLKEYTSVTNIGENFDEILHNVKVKKLVCSRTSDAKRVFKKMNTQMGLIVTLATLPFTCGFLNWVYPRIMEKIMPEMSAKKKEITLKLEEINQKVDDIVDNLNLDELTDKMKLDDLKDKIKFGILKGGNN